MLEEVVQPVKALATKPDLISVPGSHIARGTNSWECSLWYHRQTLVSVCVCVCVCAHECARIHGTCAHTTVQWDSGRSLSFCPLELVCLWGPDD
ncbi:similar to RIKEN cDNA 1110012M11, isoform CRA_c [Rattus norvegicus]|uniref:Similar to RIKEN cDNA 1110012M11, isoform CRA_c n=1 Tax=Rattus norvegicus TaxID=10116 RepID=A6K9V8_RAT|nr:similar to RIKEN cDNA 1110012M11, isoform CRA_c [Rattus norvegicus]